MELDILKLLLVSLALLSAWYGWIDRLDSRRSILSHYNNMDYSMAGEEVIE